MDIENYGRYLEAKKTVDARALNGRVWDALWRTLPNSSRLNPLQILELGAGTGSMIERVVNCHRLHHAFYTAVDHNANSLAILEKKQSAWAQILPYFMVLPCHADLFDFLQGQQAEQQEPYDLVIAHAVLDLCDVPALLPLLQSRLKPRGLGYFSLNFDGVTALEPPTSHGRAYDDHIETLYHQSMPNPHTGRTLIPHLQNSGYEIIAAGSSDWVVYATAGTYPNDEAYFLHHILHFFEQSLANHPDLEPQQWQNWLAERRAQIGRGELVYIAHQLDVLVRFGR